MTSRSQPIRGDAAERPLTGRAVLIWLLAFFGVVIGANAVLIEAAISTFGGVETASAYKAGLAFNGELAAAQRQQALRWTVTGHAERAADGAAVVELRVATAEGVPPAGVTAKATLAHPADARFDRSVDVAEVAPGVFRGAAAVQAGQWDLVIDLFRGEERVFRSRNRVMLR
ncbi:MAG: FixH family protein [Variibacter sp.]|nr:FixH family protein [Variibacter sp.]